MLLPRLITAIVGMPLLIACIHIGGIPFLLLVTGIVILAQREFYRMACAGGYDAQDIIGLLAGIALLGCMFWGGIRFGTGSENISIAVVMTTLLVILFVREFFSRSLRQSILRISVTYFGVFYIVWTLGHLFLLRDLRPLGRSYTYLLFIVIWTVDVMAYAVGKYFGRFRLAPRISPGKTIEGTAGGILAGVIIGVILQPLMFRGERILTMVLLSFVIGLVAQLSDLSESVIKRSFGVKNSSGLLPGHGGILDRFDSFIFTAPLLYYYLLLVN